MIKVFTYGTLRMGEPNYGWALHGKFTHVTRGHLDGARMWHYGAYPFVTLDGAHDDLVLGDLFTIKDAYAQSVLADLDRLEGYHPGSASNLYDRVAVTIDTQDGPHEAYTYVAGPRLAHSVVDALPRITNGDWLSPLMAH